MFRVLRLFMTVIPQAHVLLSDASGRHVGLEEEEEEEEEEGEGGR